MIYEFNSKVVPPLQQVGGKAKALIETTKAGFKVPEGFVLSVDFFSAWTREIKSTGAWKTFLDSPTKEMCDELKKKAGELTYTAEQKKAMDEGLANLSEKAVFAVRSSSPEEDLESTSFAGQYETVLGVMREKIENAIIKVFTSMLDTRVVEYKKSNNLAINNPRIAVIVQKQIASEISGIAFSLNPNNNCYDEAVINASFGLGEAIVTGQVTPDTYIVEKIKKQILDKKIAEKSHALWLNKDGGITEKENESPKAQALTDGQILELAELVTRIEEHYQKPMDIEWAISEGNLYLLQARPITSYFPLFPELVTKPGEEKYLYLDLIILTQGITESLSVLGLEIWGRMLELVTRGTYPQGKDGLFVDVHGREYMHISNILKHIGVAGAKRTMLNYDTPTNKIVQSIDLKKEYMPAVKTKKMKKMTKSAIKLIFTMVPVIIKGFIKPEKCARTYDEEGIEFLEYLVTGIDLKKDFNILVEEVLNEFAKVMKNSFLILPTMLTYNNLKKLFKNKDADDLLIALSMDMPNNPTSEMGYHMLKLASHEEIQNTGSGDEFVQKLACKEYSESVLKDYEEYINKYGFRGFKEIDIAAPRTYEDPAKLFNQLKNINIADNPMKTAKQRKEEAYNTLLAMAKKWVKKKNFLNITKSIIIYWDIVNIKNISMLLL